MIKRLAPYASAQQVSNIAKVGKNKTPRSLVERMPSPEVAAKVGPPPPSPVEARRVVRRNFRVGKN